MFIWWIFDLTWHPSSYLRLNPGKCKNISIQEVVSSDQKGDLSVWSQPEDAKTALSLVMIM